MISGWIDSVILTEEKRSFLSKMSFIEILSISSTCQQQILWVGQNVKKEGRKFLMHRNLLPIPTANMLI